MKKRRAGFTLIEMVIVLAIIAVLLTMVAPLITKYLGTAKEVACAANRQSLRTDVIASSISGEYSSCQDAFDHCYNKHDYPCPSGGTYSWKADGDYGYVVCSIHGGGEESSGSGSSGQTYNGTDLSVQTSYWPAADSYANAYDTVHVAAGGVFQYTDGNYYVVVQDLDLNKQQAASGPGGTVYNWYATMKLTGRVITGWTDSSQKSDLARGDLCKVGGSYYVFKDGGSWGSSPEQSPGQWYKIP